MIDKKSDCGYIWKVETTGFLMDSMWGVRKIEKSRITQAKRSRYPPGRSWVEESFLGKVRSSAWNMVSLKHVIRHHSKWRCEISSWIYQFRFPHGALGSRGKSGSF